MLALLIGALALTACQTGPDVDSQEGVLHVIARQAGTREALGAAGSASVELWFDREGGRYREVYRVDGQLAGEVLVTGNRRFEINVDGKATGRVGVDADDPILRKTPLLLIPGDLYQAGQGRLLGTERVQGKEALRVEIYLPLYSPPQRLTALLDAETLLALEEVYTREGETFATVVREYDVYETLPLSQVDAKLFEPVSRDQIQYTRREMNLEQAAAFEGFAIYFVGAEFNGLTIDSISRHESFAEYSAINGVWVTYWPAGKQHTGGDEAQVFVVTERATEADKVKWQSINREFPKVEVLRGNAEDGYRMEFFVGDVLVELAGRTEEEIQRMRESLTRLN